MSETTTTEEERPFSGFRYIYEEGFEDAGELQGIQFTHAEEETVSSDYTITFHTDEKSIQVHVDDIRFAQMFHNLGTSITTWFRLNRDYDWDPDGAEDGE